MALKLRYISVHLNWVRKLRYKMFILAYQFFLSLIFRKRNCSFEKAIARFYNKLLLLPRKIRNKKQGVIKCHKIC